MAISATSGSVIPTLRPSQSATPATRPLATDDNPDTVVFQLPSAPDTAEDVSFAVPKQAAPTLQRPVLLVNGYNGGPGTWKNMETWLTTDAANKDGGIVHSDGKPVAGDGKVFEMEFSTPWNSTKLDATELKTAIDKISAATGSKQVDVVAHSKGGLDTRYYLDQGGDKVNNFVMIATPNHGSQLGDVELGLRKMGVPIAPTKDDPEIRQCFQDLCVDTVTDGKANNPVVHELNANWDRQKARAHVLLIAGEGTSTLSGPNTLTIKGDGVVPEKSVELPGVPIKDVWWTTHTSVKDSPDSLLAAANFITGAPVSFSGSADPTDVAPDRDIVPIQITATADQVQYLIKDKT